MAHSKVNGDFFGRKTLNDLDKEYINDKYENSYVNDYLFEEYYKL